MSGRRRRARALLVGGTVWLVFAFVFACVGGGAWVAEDAPPPAEIQAILVVPMNFDMTPPPELQRGTELVQAEVRAYLASTGREVRRASMYDVVRHWRELAEEAGGFTSDDGELLGAELEAAREELARRLAEPTGVDTVAMPTLLIREGYYSGTWMRWDGVSRKVPVQADSLMEAQSIAGKGEATSLRMSLYAPDGSKFFERYAGLEPLLAWRMSGFGTAQGGRIEGKPRRDLFREPEIIEDAVRLSLEPLIEPPEEASE